MNIIINRAEGATGRATGYPATGALPQQWSSKGRCVTIDPDALFVWGAAQHDAKVVCRRCPVIAECLAEALDNRIEFGVWGGMTERERRAMLLQHPNVPSWWHLFETARLEQVRADRAQVGT